MPYLKVSFKQRWCICRGSISATKTAKQRPYNRAPRCSAPAFGRAEGILSLSTQHLCLSLQVGLGNVLGYYQASRQGRDSCSGKVRDDDCLFYSPKQGGAIPRPSLIAASICYETCARTRNLLRWLAGSRAWPLFAADGADPSPTHSKLWMFRAS